MATNFTGFTGSKFRVKTGGLGKKCKPVAGAGGHERKDLGKANTLKECLYECEKAAWDYNVA